MISSRWHQQEYQWCGFVDTGQQRRATNPESPPSSSHLPQFMRPRMGRALSKLQMVEQTGLPSILVSGTREFLLLPAIRLMQRFCLRERISLNRADVFVTKLNASGSGLLFFNSAGRKC